MTARRGIAEPSRLAGDRRDRAVGEGGTAGAVPLEVEVLAEVAEDLGALADVRPRVRTTVRARIQAMPVEEVVLDEFEVGVETENLVVDVTLAWHTG